MSIWKNNKTIDLWSLVHYLSGFLLGGLFYWMGTSFVNSLSFSIFILLLWEVFEYSTKIIEPFSNVLADLMLGTLGFFTAGYIYYDRNLFEPGILLTILVTNSILALWGLIDFLKTSR